MVAQTRDPSPTRESIFQDAARRMRADFEDARNNVPHRGEAGGEGERILHQFLNEHLPGRFRATTGFILDKTDRVSRQQDVIVYDALNCPIYRTSERGMIVPNDNVAATFEVKFALTSSKLSEAMDNINDTKNLVRTPHLPGHPEGEQIATYGAIFAFECELKNETVIDRWHESLTDANPLHKSCSLIAVLDRGIWVTVMGAPGEGVAPVDLQGISPGAPQGSRVGIAYMETGDQTLDVMMRLLLAHLTFFRHRIDHPGFNFSGFGPTPMKWIGTYSGNRMQYISPGGVVLPPRTE